MYKRLRPLLLVATLLVVTSSLALVSDAAAANGEAPFFVPPPPVSPSPPVAGQRRAPTLAELRLLGGVNLAWTKAIQSAYLAMQISHVLAEEDGQNASKLVFPETGLLMGHAATYLAGPWGYALAIDDGRPHRRHLGLSIGLAEQAAYALVVASLNVRARRIYYDDNLCHTGDARGCIDHFYAPASRPQAVIHYATGAAMTIFSIIHAAAAAQLIRLEAAGVMDGPAGEPYRRSRELPAPTATLLPWGDSDGAGLAIVGRF